MNEKKSIKKVTALKYNPIEDEAPKIVASGKGEIAQKILEKAKEENIPVYEDAHLAEVLTELKVGDEIPPELYEVVAEVLTFISRLDKEHSKYNIKNMRESL